MHIVMGDLVGTVDDMGVTALIQAVLEDIVLDRKIEAKWLQQIEAREARERKAWRQQVWPVFKARRQAYLAATERSVAWLRAADGSWDDLNTAARLFNGKADWCESARDLDYERISALVSAHNAS